MLAVVVTPAPLPVKTTLSAARGKEGADKVVRARRECHRRDIAVSPLVDQRVAGHNCGLGEQIAQTVPKAYLMALRQAILAVIEEPQRVDPDGVIRGELPTERKRGICER